MNWFTRVKGYSVLLSKSHKLNKYPTTKLAVDTLEEAIVHFNSDKYKLTNDSYDILTQIQFDDLWVVERLGDGSISINKDKLIELWHAELDTL